MVDYSSIGYRIHGKAHEIATLRTHVTFQGTTVAWRLHFFSGVLAKSFNQIILQ
ncbi:hypothetical protein R6G85_07105 [Actinotignum urinale]|uniref:hypothetical protein n=1 Tax=Actinotignum urinale TaxID=190146 RepID=UPI002A829D3E|nr:hypothetical protein [Actinotignum urinale]MDY5152238.1 hypothetical protein [Actinotignum urinale]